MPTKCGRHQWQRQHLRAVFLGGLKILGARLTGLRLRSVQSNLDIFFFKRIFSLAF